MRVCGWQPVSGCLYRGTLSWVHVKAVFACWRLQLDLCVTTDMDMTIDVNLGRDVDKYIFDIDIDMAVTRNRGLSQSPPPPLLHTFVAGPVLQTLVAGLCVEYCSLE